MSANMDDARTATQQPLVPQRQSLHKARSLRLGFNSGCLELSSRLDSPATRWSNIGRKLRHRQALRDSTLHCCQDCRARSKIFGSCKFKLRSRFTYIRIHVPYAECRHVLQLDLHELHCFLSFRNVSE